MHASLATPPSRLSLLLPPPSLALSILLSWLALASIAAAAPATAADDDAATRAAWRAVARGDAVAVMRHALAPGTGDPANFDVDDCTTQRNLSDAGRAQAEAIGEHIAKALGTTRIEVLSSAWCRCLDTGRLLGFGEVRRLAPLNSFFRERASAPGQTGTLRLWIDERVATPGAPPAVLVTHQVNISALTGGFAASGEIVIVDTDDTVLARILVDANRDPATR